MAEGGGLLNRYTVKSRIGGSNPPLSATFIINDLQKQHSLGITLSHNKFKDIHHCSLMLGAGQILVRISGKAYIPRVLASVLYASPYN